MSRATIWDIYQAMGVEVQEHFGKKMLVMDQNRPPQPFDIRLRVIPQSYSLDSIDGPQMVTFGVVLRRENVRGGPVFYDHEVELTLPISQVHILKD